MKRVVLAMLITLVCGSLAWADQVILDDLIVDGSACIGFDCVNGESFGFDTLRLKENNLRRNRGTQYGMRQGYSVHPNLLPPGEKGLKCAPTDSPRCCRLR